MTHGDFIRIDESKCVNCHQCIATCPVKYCNDGSGDHIALDSELCIQCGNCLKSCTHGARSTGDDCELALQDLERGVRMCAIVAPAATACFGTDNLRINGWLEHLGVEAVFDVSYGAELTVKSYVEHIKAADPDCLIAQPCPVIVSYIQLYRPELLPYLAPVHSPMLHTVRMIREYYPEYRDHEVLVVSPCIAKAREFRETGVRAYNVTVSSIERYLEQTGQSLKDFPEQAFDNSPAERAVAFSSPGGLLQTVMREMPGAEDRARTIEGPRVFPYLDGLFESICSGDAPLLVDCLNCELGCNGGPGALDFGHLTPDQLERRIRDRRRRMIDLHRDLADKLYDETESAEREIGASLERYWRRGLYQREYSANREAAARVEQPSEEDLTHIYRSMLKYDDADMLNCSSCGYNSCEGMARAIHNGLNRPQNCHLYLQKQAASRMMDNVDVGIVLIDPETHTIVHANAVALEMMGADRGDVEGRVCHGFFTTTPAGQCALTDLGNTIERATRILLTSDGSEKPILKTVKRIQIGGKELLLESFVDISERTEAEEELREINQRLHEQTTLANSLAAEAELASAAKSEFLANMSHEIRTPMTAILGFAEAARDGCPAQCSFGQREHREHLETINRNGQHLLQLINDILDLSKIEAGKLAVEQIPCSPCHIAAEAESLVRVRSDAKGIDLRIEFEGDIPVTIRSDPTRLRQILINLLSNAIKFTEIGHVSLIARLTNQPDDSPALEFDIVDTGLGMSNEQAANLFQPFVQADTSTTRKFGGSGLGLVISKRLANALGGDVQVVETRPGAGSRFRLTVATGSLDGVQMLDQPATAVWMEQNPNHTQVAKADPLDCRVLLAEDGPDNQRLITHVLKKAGAEVTVVENGELAAKEALAALAADRPFDVILMDMQMPVMDGYTATTALRAQRYGGSIIALTAHAMASDRQECIDAGCDDYATKPIDRIKLIELVRRYAQTGPVGAVDIVGEGGAPEHQPA